MDLGNLSSMWRDRGDPAFGNEVLDRMVNPASLRVRLRKRLQSPRRCVS